MLKKVISNTKRGFTLPEIMIVIVIIGILTTIAIAAGSMAKAGARDNQRKTDIRLLQLKIEAYREQDGIYPTSLAGGTNSLVSSGIISAAVLPKDPINDTDHQYVYIPLQLGSSCGASYYLYATLEKNNSQHVVTTGLTPCSGSLPTDLSKIYDVTSPSQFKQ
jgi:prepilin-type N-terminal cleavage/methylation domain-containing protein